MKAYQTKQKPAASRSDAQNAKQDAAIANSAQLSMLGSSGGAADFEAKMMARMQSFRDAQLPKAEAEADRLAASVRPGTSLDEVKASMGLKLGADFSNVRIHTGAMANDMASSIGAEAYTSGKDIYLGEDASAETAAHELVHTVQQGEVAGTGVSESVASGTVQMKEKKPGVFTRIKNWFKRRKLAQPDAKMVGRDEEIRQAPMAQTMQLAPKAKAGKYDANFAEMNDATKADELQKMLSYLNAKKSLGELSEDDMDLQTTYNSVLQQATASDTFLQTLMDNTHAAANQVYASERAWARDNTSVSKATTPAELAAESKAAASNHYQTVGLTDSAIAFNNYRNMLNHASNLMDPSERKVRFDRNRAYRNAIAKDSDPKLKAFHKQTTRGEDAYRAAMGEKGYNSESSTAMRKEKMQAIVNAYRFPGMH